MRSAIRHADPALSRFRPLPRIVSYDDFSRGMNGWVGLVGNYEDTLDNMLPAYRGMFPPQLSTATHWDTGSHGAMSGAYSLKIATRPKAGAVNLVLKRLTFIEPCPIQVELFFAVKPEANVLRLSDTDVRSFGIVLDVQDPDGGSEQRRTMPHVKYLNALGGELRQIWQYKSKAEEDRQVGSTGATRSHPHFRGEGWRDVPDGRQRLCYNELPTKLNWHYLRLGFDLRTMRVTALQCNDKRLRADAIETMVMPAWPNLWSMLNICLFCETDSDKRCFLYVDSVLVSGDWTDA
jgi:hypothetical protein